MVRKSSRIRSGPVAQLSPSEKTGQKKIEMFNTGGELALFREVGMDPVFFGEALLGTRVPNLTYMLGGRDKNVLPIVGPSIWRQRIDA